MRSVVVVALILAGACVDRGPGPQPKVDPKYVREHLLPDVPTDITRFDVKLGDGVIYLGNKLDRARLIPGETIKLTHYWKVVNPPGRRWRPFALVRGPAGSADFMNLDPTDMQRGHPVATWKAGELIEDVQTITVRPDWRSPYATVFVGLIEVGKHGTLDRMAATGAPTQDRAVVAAKLEIDLARAPPPAGTIHIPRANGPIVIDGMAIDPGWTSAVLSPEFVTAEGFKEDPIGKATAKMVWDDHYLYLFVSIVDSDIATTWTKHDDPMWKADCVEIFIDADGNRRGYVELQVNPNNVTFDSWFAGPRGPAGDVSWDSGMVTATKVRGTPTPGDSDQAWEVEIGIPWAAIKGRDEQMPVTIPPHVGDRWRLNVVRVDKRSANDNVIASSWNRITLQDFHGLDRMLVAVFADVTGSIVASPGSGSGSAASTLAPTPTPDTTTSGLPPAEPRGSATPVEREHTVQPSLHVGSGARPVPGGGTGSGSGGGSGRGPAAGSAR